MTNKFEFNEEIAESFVSYAQKHIPNYDIVINKCVNICDKFLTKDSSICDFGCATGHTLLQLYKAGFSNLSGIDTSKAMLARCPKDIAKYYEYFPFKIFKIILCNWTLHFIEEKQLILNQFYNNLDTHGYLVITDKTSKDKIPLDFYHDFKKSKGLSDLEIIEKKESVEDMMFINSPTLYIETLQEIGFSEVYIIDASYCFTTFLAIK